MHNTEIGIFKIAQTRVNWPEVIDWLKFIGVKFPEDVERQLHTATSTDASQLIALAGKRCYLSFDTDLNPNISSIRTDHEKYIENVLNSKHGSVTEHATWSFAIENVSRVFTGEMNRHRAGVAISDGSMRYIRFDDIGFTLPDSIIESEEEHAANQRLLKVLDDPSLEDGPAPDPSIEDLEDQVLLANRDRKLRTRVVFEEAFNKVESLYLDLCNIWKIGEMKDFSQKKKLTSMFRRIVGMGVSTGGVWTLNARALRWVIQQRANKDAAEEEIYHVFNKIAETMVQDEPLLFGDFQKDEKGNWVPKHYKV